MDNVIILLLIIAIGIGIYYFFNTISKKNAQIKFYKKKYSKQNKRSEHKKINDIKDHLEEDTDREDNISMLDDVQSLDNSVCSMNSKLSQ